MTPERIQKAQQVLANPRAYKVCEGCGSIVTKDIIVCPNCNAYRFDENENYVSDQAIVLASRNRTTVTPEDLMN
ncbi:MAG: hypothetical protein Q4C05_08455 [Akkermansia sp.]|nr:hypothetical protein [Akkermansia sp.]